MIIRNKIGKVSQHQIERSQDLDTHDKVCANRINFSFDNTPPASFIHPNRTSSFTTRFNS